MRKSVKVLLITAGCLVAVGAIVGSAALLLTHGKWEKLSYPSNTPYTERSETFPAAQVERLDIEAVADDVEFIVTDGSEYRVTCSENQKHEYDISLSGGTLKVAFKDISFSIPYGLDFNSRYNKLLIEVPSECARADIESVSGDVSLPDGLSFGGALAVCTVSGDVSIGKVCVQGDAEVCSTSGEISVRGASVSGRLAGSSVSGDFDLSDTVCSGDASISTTSGEVLASGFTCAMLDISSISGDVRFSALDCTGAEIDTTSGEVLIDLTEPGQFRYDCKSVSGDVRLPNASGNARSFKVDTVSGGIKIS